MNITQLIKSISQKEWWALGTLTLIIIILTSLPVIYGLIKAPLNYQISGLDALTPADSNVYFSYINQIKAGSYLLHDQFTTEQQSHGLLNVAWLIVGLLARYAHLSAVAAYTLARLLFIPLLIFVSYLFIAYFFSDKKKRLLAIWLVSLGSGLGAYFDYLNSSTGMIYNRALDLWMPEVNFFNSMFHVPHFILASALMILTFLLFLIGVEQNKKLYSVLAGITALSLFNFHPYHLPVIYLTPLIYCLSLIIEKRLTIKIAIKHYLLLVFCSLPSIFYHFYTLLDPIIGSRATQNITPASPFFFTLIGLGLPLIFGFYGIYIYFKNSKTLFDQRLFLIIWVIVSLLFTILPFWQFGRRSIQGITMPLTILAIDALFFLAYRWRQSWFYPVLRTPLVLTALLIAFWLPTSLFNVARDIELYSERHPFLYLSNKQIESYSFLNSLPPGHVLARPLTANFLAGNTNKTFFLAHAHETIQSAKKTKLLSTFFDKKTSPAWRQKFIQDYNIKYFYWDQTDNAALGNFDLDSLSAKKLFDNEQIKVYEFTN